MAAVLLCAALKAYENKFEQMQALIKIYQNLHTVATMNC